MKLYSLIIALLISIIPNAVQCGILEEMKADGTIKQVLAPQFTDPAQAKSFAARCRALAAELEQNYTATPDIANLHKQAVLAGEFLDGKPYILKTTRVPSIIKLREWVKAPAPEGVAYVKIYPSREALPSFVRPGFNNPDTKGLTIDGRYIAILHSPYPKAMEDVLSHEMVHAYLTLASPRPLPLWFQEGAAVYFSTGKDNKYYGREAGVPEGVMTTLPEDYKNNLFVFNYLEQRVGRDKVYKFIRETLRTGNPDMRVVGFGFADQKAAQQARDNRRTGIFVIAGTLILTAAIGITAAVIARRREVY